MQMMRLRGVWTTNLTGFLIGFGMYSSFVLIPQFVETPPSTGYGFGSSVTQAGPLPDPVDDDDADRGPDRRPAVGAVRVEGAARARRRPHAARVRPAGGGALGALAGLPGVRSARHRRRILLRLDGEPDRRGRPARPDRRRDRDERGHANDRRRDRRPGRGQPPRCDAIADGLPGEKGYTISFAVMALALVAARLSALAVPGRKVASRASRWARRRARHGWSDRRLAGPTRASRRAANARAPASRRARAFTRYAGEAFAASRCSSAAEEPRRGLAVERASPCRRAGSRGRLRVLVNGRSADVGSLGSAPKRLLLGSVTRPARRPPAPSSSCARSKAAASTSTGASRKVLLLPIALSAPRTSSSTPVRSPPR